MQKFLTDAQTARVKSLIALSELAVRFLGACKCNCCGSIDPLHDEQACYQAGYITFDLWRSEMMDAGLWNGRNAMSEEEYSEALAREYSDEEENAPDIEDESFFTGADRLCYPGQGLY